MDNAMCRWGFVVLLLVALVGCGPDVEPKPDEPAPDTQPDDDGAFDTVEPEEQPSLPRQCRMDCSKSYEGYVECSSARPQHDRCDWCDSIWDDFAASAAEKFANEVACIDEAAGDCDVWTQCMRDL